MLRTEVLRLVRRFLMLGALVACLGVMMSGPLAKGLVLPCCSSCDITYDRCVAGCSTQACLDSCDAKFSFCVSHCQPSC
jgi:hypothetical protein